MGPDPGNVLNGKNDRNNPFQLMKRWSKPGIKTGNTFKDYGDDTDQDYKGDTNESK